MQILCNKYWDTYCEVFPDLVKFDPPKIIVNNRLTKCAGYCDMQNNTIHMGGKYFTQFMDNMRKVILPHELAHQIDYNLFGWKAYKKHHGKLWQNIMINIGQEPNPYHSMELK